VRPDSNIPASITSNSNFNNQNLSSNPSEKKQNQVVTPSNFLTSPAMNTGSDNIQYTPSLPNNNYEFSK
jgi:hypothetical protein